MSAVSLPPAARGDLLHVDKRLLQSDFHVDPDDVLPSDDEPRFLAQPPVPTLGTDSEHYTEGTGARRFRKAPRLRAGEQLLPSAGPEASGRLARRRPPPPNGGTQAAMFLLGVAFHASAGVQGASKRTA